MRIGRAKPLNYFSGRWQISGQRTAEGQAVTTAESRVLFDDSKALLLSKLAGLHKRANQWMHFAAED
jgi:hypothetical protein